MSKKNDCWGIEVGSYAIKAIRLVRNGEKITVADFDVLPFKQVLTTPDLNVDEAIQLNLDQFLSKRSVSRSSVVVSVPGNAAFARFAKLPPVEPKRIPSIVKYEAVQQIPFPIDQVEWDYQVFSKPDSPDVEVGIFAITRERVNQFLGNFRAVGIEVDAVTLSPLAVFNAMSYDMGLDDDSPGVIFMDIGTSSTDVIIVEEGNLWLRTLPKGGSNFTEALVRAFKLSNAKAEKLKREAGTSKYARQIIQAMRPVFADLVQEMQRSLGYYQSINRDTDVSRLVGVGSTFRLPGMQKFLKQQLQMDVTRPEGFERLEVDNKIAADFSQHALSMVTSYGLAVQGLGLARVEANIMPQQVLKQRNWRAKQPWFIAAAALFVAASTAAYIKLWNEQQKVQVEQASVTQVASRVTGKAQQLVSAFNQIQDSGEDPRQKIDNLRRILDYRDVWPKLMYDLDQAAKNIQPQPALVTADYSQIEQIPRQQRQRVYIDKITTEYQFGMTATARESASSSSGMSLDEIWASSPEEEAAPQASQDPTQVTDEQKFLPPSFVVTVEGTTPYAQGPRLVIERYIDWFRRNGRLAGRPYRIARDSVQPGPMWQESSGSQTPTPQSPRSRSGGFFGTPQPQGPSRSGQNIVQQIVPQFPLAEEPRGTDWRFSFKFTVQLVRPEEARRAEKTDLDQQPGQAGQDSGQDQAPATPTNTEAQP